MQEERVKSKKHGFKRPVIDQNTRKRSLFFMKASFFYIYRRTENYPNTFFERGASYGKATALRRYGRRARRI